MLSRVRVRLTRIKSGGEHLLHTHQLVLWWKKKKKKHKKPTVSEKKKTVKEVGGKGKCLFQELLTAFGKCSGKLSFQERDGQ